MFIINAFLIFTITLQSRYYYLYFIVEETEPLVGIKFIQDYRARKRRAGLGTLV
jgi:hypothetical protein